MDDLLPNHSLKQGVHSQEMFTKSCLLVLLSVPLGTDLAGPTHLHGGAI